MTWSTLCSFVCVAPLFVCHLHRSKAELPGDVADGRSSDENCLIQISRSAVVLPAREAATKHYERLTAHTNKSQSISAGFLDTHNVYLASRMNSSLSHSMGDALASQDRLVANRTITVSSKMPPLHQIFYTGGCLLMGVWICGWSVGWAMSQYQKQQLSMHLDAKRLQPEAPSESASESDGGKSIRDPENQPDPNFYEIVFAVLIYAPGLGLVTATLMILWTAQQILVLPFRVCGGKPLVAALNFSSPLMSSVVFAFVTGSSGETCYGRVIDRDRCKSFEDFLQPCSASRRKNIRRNLKASEQALQKNEFEVSYHEAGSWRITSEMRALLWNQCELHVTRVFGWPDIMNCQQPVSPRVMYFGELLLLLAFACDIQLVKARDGKIVSLNTRVHVGDVLFNPNYATDPEHGQDGIYSWVGHDFVKQAIQLGVGTVNMMPSMRSAKRILGMRSLHLGSLFCACWSYTPSRPGPKAALEKRQQPQPVLSQAAITAVGGKRAARKRAANLAESTDTSPASSPTRNVAAGTDKSPVDSLKRNMAASTNSSTVSSPTRSIPEAAPEKRQEPQPELSQADVTTVGGKQAARKRAANLAESTGTSSVTSPTRKVAAGTDNSPVDSQELGSEH